MKALKLGNVAMCEYAAEGARGKHTLVNVYTGDIRVKAMPATFPIGVYIEMQPQPNQPSEFVLEVSVGDDLMGKLMGEFPPFEPDKGALIVVPQIPVTITQESTIRVTAICPGFRRTTVFEKKVTLDPTV